MRRRTTSPDGVAPLDIAWLAGLLEGEGSFFPGPPSSPGRPVISVSMVDRDVMERVAQLFGRKATAMPSRRPHWQPAYVLRVSGTPAVEWMVALRPLLGERRRTQIDRALATYVPDTRRVLDDDAARAALERLAGGMSVREVAEEFGTTVWTMYDLRLGRSYKHLARPAGLEPAAASTMR